MFSTSGIAKTPQLRLVCAGVTDTGMVRSENQDRYGIYTDLGLVVVCDGMGGAAAGEVASRMAVDHICEEIAEGEVASPDAMLAAAIMRANEHVHAESRSSTRWRGMGTTVAAMLVRDRRAALAHVGDSRIYRLRSSVLAQLTEDHSFFNQLVREGLADPNHPEKFTRHNWITRAIGPRFTVEVDVKTVGVTRGDVFLLCSDGLSGVLKHAEIEAALREHPDPDDAAMVLVKQANARGGPDNITAVVVKCA